MEFKEEKDIRPFLTLIIKGINGWSVALCPEFDVSACGPSSDVAISDLHNMIRANASLYVKSGNAPSQILKWSEEVIKHCDEMPKLFKNVRTSV